MRPVTESFLDAVYEPHRLAVQVDVLANGAVAKTLTTVTAGTVTLDASASVRGRCSITLTDDGTLGLVPQGPTDLLAPYGNELRVYRGILYPTGAKALVSLIIARIDDTNVEEGADGMTITISGLDRSARIIDARFEEPYQIAAGTNVGTAILSTIRQAYPGVVRSFATTSATTPALLAEEGGDRWAFCTEMAKSAGMRLYFNGSGTLILAPDVTTGTPVAQIVEGENGVLVTAARQWDRVGAYNAVIATGENTGETAPARGTAYDLDPESPTYYHGAFGRVPRFYASPFLKTNAMATDAAQSILRRELGTTQRVSFGSFVNPALEPGDIVHITRHRVRINEAHILDAVTIPLSASDPLTGTTRATQATGTYTPPPAAEPAPAPAPEPAPTPTTGSSALLESGDTALLESNDRVLLEA